MIRTPATRFEARLEDGRPVWLERRPLAESASSLARVASSHRVPVDDLDLHSPDPARGLAWEAYTGGPGGPVPVGTGVLVRGRDPEAATAVLVVAEGPQRAVVAELLVGTLQVSVLGLGVSRLSVRVAVDDPLLLALLARLDARLAGSTDRFAVLEISRATRGRTLVSSGTFPQLPPNSRPAA
jgi:hypothetical protein